MNTPRLKIRHIFATLFWTFLIWWAFVVVMSIDSTPIPMV